MNCFIVFVKTISSHFDFAIKLAYTGYKRRMGDSSPDQKTATESPQLLMTETNLNTTKVNNNKIPDEIIDIPKQNGVHNVAPQPAPRRTSAAKESVTSDDGNKTIETSKEESTTVSSEVSHKLNFYLSMLFLYLLSKLSINIFYLLILCC